MTINYQPRNVLRRMAPKKKIEKLLTQKLTVNKTALHAITDSGIVGQKQLEKIALKVIKQYKKREKAEIKDGATKKAARSDTLDNKKLMIQRVQNATVSEITKAVQDKYVGEFYEWLESTAENPREDHKENYGKIFQIGVGDANGNDPGDEIGCMCGMRILVKENRLNLED